MTSESNITSRTLPDLVLDIDYTDEKCEHSLPLNEASNVTVTPCCSKSSKSAADNLTSASQQINNSKHKHSFSHSEDLKSSKADSKTTPRRCQLNNSRAPSKLRPAIQSSSRPCQQHSFLTDITEVRQMEQGLLKLLDDFHCGKLQAFGKDCTFEKMEQVREQQERLARLHFELNAQQEIYGPQSEDGRRIGRENLGKLIENLQQLSRSIYSVNNYKFQAQVCRPTCKFLHSSAQLNRNSSCALPSRRTKLSQC